MIVTATKDFLQEAAHIQQEYDVLPKSLPDITTVEFVSFWHTAKEDVSSS